MPLSSVSVGDVIEDRSGMTGAVSKTPAMLNIRREFRPDGELLQVCLCDVRTDAGQHEIMFVLDRCHLVRKRG